MIDIVVVNLTETNGVDQILIKDSGFNETTEQSLHLFLVGEGSVHFVRFLLEGGHFRFDGFEMVLEIVEDCLQFLHDVIGDCELRTQALELFTDLDIVVGCLFLHDL